LTWEDEAVGLVFINYRKKEQSLGPAAIHRELVAHFGPDQVFQDYVSIRPGQMYPVELRQALARANLLVAVIGPDWLTMTDEHGVRLLDRDDDWVRHEIAVALARGIRVVPVLLNGTDPPAAERLPSDIRRLARAQAIEIHGRNLGDGLAELVDACHAAGVWPPAPPDTASTPGAPWWRSRAVLFAIVVIAGMAVLLVRPWREDGADPADEPDVTTSPRTTSSGPDGSPVRYDEPISVQRTIDLDQVSPRGDGDADIRIDTPTQLDPGSGAVVVPWEGERVPSRSDCADILAGALDDVPVFDFQVGDYLCVRTNEGRTARLKSTGLSDNGRFTFDATVWES
jgi:hypothetical protein